MPKTLSGTDPAMVVLNKHLVEQVLAFIRDLLPHGIFVFNFGLVHSSQDFIIVVAIEWGLAAKKDIENNTTAPDIALAVILLKKNFGGDVVWRANCLLQLLAWIKSY